MHIQTALRGFAALAVLLTSGAATARTFHVAPGGNDGNSGGPGDPFATIQQGIRSAEPGDTVQVGAGVYAEQVFLIQSGTPSAPIVLEGETGAVVTSPNPAAEVNGISVSEGVGYLEIRNLEVKGGFGQAILLRQNSHHITIESVRVHGNRVGIAALGCSDVRVSDSTLYANRRAGMRISGAARGIRVADTESYGNTDGRGCSGESDGFVSDDDAVQDVVFERVQSHENGEDGFDLKGADIRLDRIETWGNCNGYKLRRNAVITNSVSRSEKYGMKLKGDFNDDRIQVLHCTLVNNDFPIVMNAATLPATGYAVDLFNSVIFSRNRAFDYVASVRLREGRNLLWRPDPSQPLIQQLTSRKTFSGDAINRGEWAAYSGQGEGTYSVDPQFVSLADADFSLADGSPAIDRGLPGLGGDFDLAGRARTQGLAPDLGALETSFQGGNQAPRVSLLTNPARSSRANRPTTFDASRSFDLDGDALEFSWDFGDGTLAQGSAILQHTYLYGGNYPVVLRVSDGQETTALRRTITVIGRRAPTPAVTPTGTIHPTPTPTPGPSAGRLRINMTMARTARAGSRLPITVIYRGVEGTGVLTVNLPPDLQVESVTPAVLQPTGMPGQWSGVLPRESGNIRFRGSLAADLVPGMSLPASSRIDLSPGDRHVVIQRQLLVR